MTVDLGINIVDLYIRVSTTEQAEEGYSVEEQENKLRAYCEAYGYRINKVCVDPGYSGATLDRPALKELMADVKAKKCNRVLVWKLDRLSRSQKDTLILLEDVFMANGCDFISLMEAFDTSTAFGLCAVGILAAFAQMERENIKARTTMGRIAKIKKGYFGGSHCPIGYRFKEGCNELIVDPYYSVIIRDVYKMFLSGYNLTAIGKAILDKYGDRSYDWSKNTAVKRILSNPVYMGKVKHHSEIYDGIHDSIVSESDWYRAAAILEQNRSASKRTYNFKVSGSGHADHLLTGLLYCGDCGARMYAKQFKSKKKYVCYSVAHGAAGMVKSDNCTNRKHPYTVEQLDEIVIDEIRKLSLDRTIFDSLVNECSNSSVSELPVLQERANDIVKQEERILNLYQAGIMGLDEISGRLGSLKEEYEKLQQSIAAIEAAGAGANLEDVWAEISNFSVVVDSGDFEALHHLIHSLVSKIVVLNEDITIYWSFV